MYFVIYKGNMFGFTVSEQFENLCDAQDRVKELYENGCRQVKLSQEIPMKVNVTIQF
jgi:hypothetical protein